MKCEECGGTDDVMNVSEFWSCGGNNSFAFEFRKFENENKFLCYDCEHKLFHCCAECGALIDNYCLLGAEDYNDEGDFSGYKCPECGEVME